VILSVSHLGNTIIVVGIALLRLIPFAWSAVNILSTAPLFIPAEKEFENDADASFSNRSIGADAPAAAFGETASADFASAWNKFENDADASFSNRSIGASCGRLQKESLIRLFAAFVLDAAAYLILHKVIRGQWNCLHTVSLLLHGQMTYREFLYCPELTLAFWAAGMAISGLCSIHLKGEKNGLIFHAFSLRSRFDCAASLLTLTLSLIGFCISLQGSRHLSINEVYVSSTNSLSDYAEIYNRGIFAEDLRSVGLSNKAGTPCKVLSSDTTVAAGGYTDIQIDPAIFVPKDDGRVTVCLAEEDGDLLDRVDVPGQSEEDLHHNWSYSRMADGTWKYQKATPSMANITVQAPALSVAAGFYSNPFDLTITSEPRTVVHYTLDSRTPTAESTVYDGPIHIYDRSSDPNVYRAIPNVVLDWKNTKNDDTDPVAKCMVVRAVAVAPGGQTSDVVTASYFVGHDDITQFNIVSLVSEPDDLFGSDGIYSTGQKYDDWYLNGQEGDAPAANFEDRNRECETNLELFREGSLYLQQDCGLKIQGHSARSGYVKRLGIYARMKYSGTRYFEKDLYDCKKTHSVYLRPGFDNALDMTLPADRDLVTAKEIKTLVFLDGEFWYESFMQERYNRDYFQETYGLSHVEYMRKFLPDNLKDFLSSHDLSKEKDYAQFEQLADVQSLIDCLCCNVYYANCDYSETNNSFVWRSTVKTDDGYGDGRWRWGLWDLDLDTAYGKSDWGLQDLKDYQVNSYQVMKSWSKPLHDWESFKALKKSSQFCRQFTSTMMDLINTDFRPERVAPLMEVWNRDITENDSFYQNRPAEVIKDTAEEFGLSGKTGEIAVSASDPEAGSVQVNTALPDLSQGEWTGTYYTDYPVLITAKTAEGYHFVGWQGDTDSDDATIQITPKENETIHLEAVFEKN